MHFPQALRCWLSCLTCHNAFTNYYTSKSLMTVYTLLLEFTSKDNCISADVSGAAARTCFESRKCNLRQFLIFLSVTGTFL